MRNIERIASHIKSLPRSGIRDFFELVIGMRDVISLGVGEPDFDTPWNIREAAIYACEIGKTMYTSNRGLESLRTAVSVYLKNRWNLAYHPADEILITTGVSEAMDLAIRAVTEPGDEIIIFEPSFVSYVPEVRMALGVPVCIPLNMKNGFKPDLKTLQTCISSRTKAIIINSPNNPTGAAASYKTLSAISDLALKNNILIITDDIYTELFYGKETCPSIAGIPALKNNLIYLNGFSKAYAMTGFRLGYVCAPPDLTEAMMKIHQYTMMCAPIVSQEAGLEALQNSAPDVLYMKEEYRKRRDYVFSFLTEDIGLDCHLPEGAFYIFPSIAKTGMQAVEFCTGLLKKEKVACVPGTAFGSSYKKHIRISYASSMDELEEAMRRIKKYCSGKKRRTLYSGG